MQRLYITREQLARFCPDQKALRAMEDLFDDMNELVDIDIDQIVALAIGGDARATQAVAAIEALAQALGVLVNAEPLAEQLLQAVRDLQNRPAPASEYVAPDLIMPAVDWAAIEAAQSKGPAFYKDLTSADSPYTVTHETEYLFCDATGGAITINLMGVKEGRMVIAKKTDASANIVSLASSDNIDGAATFDLLLQHENVSVVSSSSTYWAMP